MLIITLNLIYALPDIIIQNIICIPMEFANYDMINHIISPQCFCVYIRLNYMPVEYDKWKNQASSIFYNAINILCFQYSVSYIVS